VLTVTLDRVLKAVRAAISRGISLNLSFRLSAECVIQPSCGPMARFSLWEYYYSFRHLQWGWAKSQRFRGDGRSPISGLHWRGLSVTEFTPAVVTWVMAYPWLSDHKAASPSSSSRQHPLQYW